MCLTSIELAPGRRSKAASWEEVAEFVLVQDESELDNQTKYQRGLPDFGSRKGMVTLQ